MIIQGCVCRAQACRTDKEKHCKEPGTKSLPPLEGSGYWDHQNCREKKGDCPPKLKTAAQWCSPPPQAQHLPSQFTCVTCHASQQNLLHLGLHNFSSSGMLWMPQCASEHWKTRVGHCRWSAAPRITLPTLWEVVHTNLIVDYKCWCADVTLPRWVIDPLLGLLHRDLDHSTENLYAPTPHNDLKVHVCLSQHQDDPSLLK